MTELLEEQVGQQLLAQNLTIACAESCTGGLLTSRLTDIAGSSAYVMGSVVSYTNRIKESLVGVRHETLLSHGAVSEETAREIDRKSTRLNSSHFLLSRMPSSA